MSASSAPTISEPLLIGSILIGADEMIGAMVKARIDFMRDREWGPFTALGVVRRGHLVGGVVYHAYRPQSFDIEMSAAFDQVGWALPGTVRALLAYPFETLGCRRVTCTVGRKNNKARELLKDLGFKLEGTHPLALDGYEDAMSYGLLKKHCRWIKNGQEKLTDTARAA